MGVKVLAKELRGMGNRKYIIIMRSVNFFKINNEKKKNKNKQFYR
jgi:hypothetical protein